MEYAKYEDGETITIISGSKRLKAYCLACSEPVHFVKDHTRKHPSKDEKTRVRAHFRHTNNIHASAEFLRQHHPESIAHIAAKRAISKGKFHFSIRCGGCPKILPIKLEGERRVEVSYSKYRLDVAYLNGDNIVGGVEVLHSSRVSDDKFRYLDENLPWCEVKAERVLKSTGHIFAERSHNQICESCKRIEARMLAGRARKERLLEQERLERERVERRLLEQERLERERVERWVQQELEKMERERVEQEEQERKERERVNQKERERVKQERLERERVKQERQEQERIEEEKKRQERQEQERIEEEKKRQERIEQGQIAEERNKREGEWNKYQKQMELYRELCLL